MAGSTVRPVSKRGPPCASASSVIGQPFTLLLPCRVRSSRQVDSRQSRTEKSVPGGGGTMTDIKGERLGEELVEGT